MRFRQTTIAAVLSIGICVLAIATVIVDGRALQTLPSSLGDAGSETEDDGGSTIDMTLIGLALPIVTVGSSDGEAAVCSGAFVDPGWFVTAAHCVDISGQGTGAVVVNGAEPQLALVEQAVVHPTLDVALLKVEVELESTSILSLNEDVGALIHQKAYSRVFGPHNAGVSRSRSWASQVVVSVEATSLTAQVVTASGPCVGDSGGALIVNDKNGTRTVVGFLSNGSMSCQGPDEYVRADRLREWIRLTVAKPPVDDGRWRGIMSQTRCLSGKVLRCEDIGGQFGSCRVPARVPVCEVGQLITSSCIAKSRSLTSLPGSIPHCAQALTEAL